MTTAIVRTTIAATLVAFVCSVTYAEDAKPSAYAPAAELDAQIDDYIERLTDDLESPEDFNEELADQISLTATTIEVLSLVLAKHDGDSKYKAAAPAMMKAAHALADDCETHKAASANLAALSKSLEEQVDPGELKWTSVGDIELLMKQVPIVFNSLRRGVEGRRFSRSADKNARAAAALAAIAQTTQFDTLYCSDEADEAEWAAISKQMRDSGGAIVKAVRADDQDAAIAAMEKMEQSCTNCHKSFRN